MRPETLILTMQRHEIHGNKLCAFQKVKEVKTGRNFCSRDSLTAKPLKTLTHDYNPQTPRHFATAPRCMRESSTTRAQRLCDIARCFRDALTLNVVFGGISLQNLPPRNARDSKLQCLSAIGHLLRKMVSQRAVLGGFALWHLFPWTWRSSVI